MARKVKSIKFSKTEWSEVQARAKHEDLPPSTYVREISTGHLEAESVEARRELVHWMRRVVAHLKELRRELRSAPYGAARGGFAQKELAEEIREIREAARRVERYYGSDESRPSESSPSGGEGHAVDGPGDALPYMSFLEVSDEHEF